MSNQTTSHILMIRPARFGFNEQTAESNAFQDVNFGQANQANAQTIALEEFDEMVRQLRQAGVEVITIDDTPEPHTPDSIFPNNWVSFHNDGRVVLYPMQAENRRLERRNDIIEQINLHFHIKNIIDLSYFEKEEKFLEGTGSMVLDRANNKAYSCLSPRTHEEVLAEFGKQLDYSIIKFRAVNDGKEIYHTNVLMCIGDLFAVICLEAIPDLDERLMVRQALEQDKKQIIEISLEQMNHFAGNMLQVKTNKGDNLLVMSTAAYTSLTTKQIRQLEEYATLKHFDLSMIEGNGGGSARCMMAEVHLVDN